jgi:serine/threonine-protein phosphatase 2A regulatory subunit A
MLLLLGQQLLNVMRYVTVHPKDTMEYLPLIERLCGVEETVVRDQAVILAQFLCVRNAECNDSRIMESSLPVWLNAVKRLQSADWFTAKVSCAGILPPVLQLANSASRAASGGAAATAPSSTAPTSQQLQILHLYRELCNDETPMVRRAAAKHLGKFLYHTAYIGQNASSSSTAATATALTADTTTFASTQVIALAHDEQDSVRLLAVASIAQAGALYGQINPSWTVQHWIPIIRDGATDLSWYVHLVKKSCAWSCTVSALFVWFVTHTRACSFD